MRNKKTITKKKIKKIYKYEKMLNNIDYKIKTPKHKRAKKVPLYIEYKDTIISLSLACILLLVLIFTNTQPLVYIKSDNSYLAPQVYNE